VSVNRFLYNLMVKRVYYNLEINTVDIAAEFLRGIVDRVINTDDYCYNRKGNPFCHPYPIATALCIDDNTLVEITPHTITMETLAENDHIACSIETWSLASHFENNVRTNKRPPEDDIAYLMAICGAAQCAPSSMWVQSLDGILPQPILRAIDFLQFPKFSGAYMPDFRKKDTYMKLADAGIVCNLPLSPLLQPGRDIDIIIIIDTSSGIPGDELRKAVPLLAKRGIKIDVPSEIPRPAFLIFKTEKIQLIYILGFSENHFTKANYTTAEIQETITKASNFIKQHKTDLQSFLLNHTS